jgi:hypothetical protein
MLFWLVGYGYFNRSAAWPVIVPNVLLFILLLVLGWATFGAPIK